MTGKARVFVGCDDRSRIAEQALKSSIQRNASMEVDFVWMRHTEPPFDWSAVPRLPWEPGGWATQFSNFSYAVPELCAFRGARSSSIQTWWSLAIFGSCGTLGKAGRGYRFPWTERMCLSSTANPSKTLPGGRAFAR